MRATLVAAGALALLALLGGAPPLATAAPGEPIDLHVVGGDGWRPDPGFDLEWVDPPPAGKPLLATRYRVRDPLGAEISAGRLDRVGGSVAGLSVGGAPGVYTAEIWLEDVDGAEGPAATVPVRFDDAVPPAVTAPQVGGWIGRTAFPLTFQIGPPLSPGPVSGIRGYAVAIDADPEGEPCAATDRCTADETTLSAGPLGELTIPTLPEGTNHLHVATVSGAGVRSAPGHAPLPVDTVDPVTRLAGLPGGWANRPIRLTARASDAGSGMEHDGHGPPPIVAIRIDGGAPAAAVGAAVRTTAIGEGVHTVAYYARDAAGNADDGGDSNGVAHRPPSTALVRIDRTPPRVAFANDQRSDDPDLIRVRVYDPLSGPDLARGRIEARPAGSGDRFRPLPMERSGPGELRARWDSDAYPPGLYELRTVGFDKAGNATVARLRRDGTTMILASPLKLPTTLEAGFGGRTLTWHRCARRRGRRHCRRETIAAFERRPATRTVPVGGGVRLGGRLVAATGAALGGAPVRIVERFPSGTPARVRASTVWTAPDGTFSARLDPGPSREITASFGGDRRLARTAGRTLRLRVRSAVRLSAGATVAEVGGAPIVFHGRVAAFPGAIPDDGLAVQMQFRLPGIRWTEFRSVQTDSRGRFRLAYRFSDDDSRGVRFHFRAHVPAQAAWPYAPGGSRPIAVRGR